VRSRRLHTPTSEPSSGPILAYLRFAKSYNVNNKPTREYELLRETCRIIRPHYAQIPASEFGPLALKVVR
jgi:hypothetical protein